MYNEMNLTQFMEETDLPTAWNTGWKINKFIKKNKPSTYNNFIIIISNEFIFWCVDFDFPFLSLIAHRHVLSFRESLKCDENSSSCSVRNTPDADYMDCILSAILPVISL